MTERDTIFIDGKWVDSTGTGTLTVINPASEEPAAAEAGLPDDVFNLVSGTGREIGEAIATRHELGGKSPTSSSTRPISSGPSSSGSRMPSGTPARSVRCAVTSRSGSTRGLRLVAGGPEAPEGLDRGYLVRPTALIN